MPLVAPLEATRWSVTSLLPMSVLVTSRAMPVVVSMVLPLPVTVRVPLVSARSPRPLVASRSRPPPEKFSVWPSLLVMATASPAPVLIVLVAPLNVVEPPVLPESVIPPPASLVSLMLPPKVTAPPVRVVTSAVEPVPLPSVPA